MRQLNLVTPFGQVQVKCDLRHYVITQPRCAYASARAAVVHRCAIIRVLGCVFCCATRATLTLRCTVMAGIDVDVQVGADEEEAFMEGKSKRKDSTR